MLFWFIITIMLIIIIFIIWYFLGNNRGSAMDSDNKAGLFWAVLIFILSVLMLWFIYNKN
jgi:Na+/H+ antiporter NhaC